MVRPVNVATLTCSQCRKCLSVPPIYCFTDTNGIGQNVCGRCKVPTGITAVRNTGYECLARPFHFPCSVSKECKELISLDNARMHEDSCKYRQIRCPLCPKSLLVQAVANHFKSDHYKHYQDKKFIVEHELPLSYPSINTYLVIYPSPSITCFVTVNIDRNKQDIPICIISVEPLSTLNEPHVFSITFGDADKKACFNNKKIGTSYIVYVNDVLDFLKMRTFRIKVKVFTENKIDGKAVNLKKRRSFKAIFKKLALFCAILLALVAYINRRV